MAVTTPPQLTDRAPELIAVLSTFGTLATICIWLRMYCRILVVRSFGLDDLFAFLAWIFFTLFVGFGILACYNGSAVHVAHMANPALIPTGIKYWMIDEPIYIIANMALKASIGLFMLRLAVAKSHRIIFWAIIVLTQLYGIFFVFLFIFQCIPVEYFWTRYITTKVYKGRCIDANITVNAMYFYSAFSCLADWTLAILPIFMIWNLQMDKSTKVSIAMLLCVGAIASIATIIRILYVQGMQDTSDFLYSVTDVAVWSTAETGIGISASCIATLRPLLSRWNKAAVETNPLKGNIHSLGWSGQKAKGYYSRSDKKGAAAAWDSELMTLADGKTMATVSVHDSGSSGGTPDSGDGRCENIKVETEIVSTREWDHANQHSTESWEWAKGNSTAEAHGPARS